MSLVWHQTRRTPIDVQLDVIVITGGMQGLGRELAILFAIRQYTTIVLDINIPIPEDQVAGVIYYKCNVGDAMEVKKVNRIIRQEHGIPTVLINNAGVLRGAGKTVIELTEHELDECLRINLVASFITTKEFVPAMIAKKRGYVVTVASVLGYAAPARLSAYSVTKAGLIALHESLTYELGPPSNPRTGVHTLLVCPGQIGSQMFRSVRTPSTMIAPVLDPKFVAGRIVKNLERGKIGQIKIPLYVILMPLMRVLPWQVVEALRMYSGMDVATEGLRLYR